MIEFAKLEFRKARILLVGMALTFLASVPFVGLVALSRHYTFMQGVSATLLFWTLVGLPVIALIFGAAIGGGLRQAPAIEAEAPLPVSPHQRVGGAALAGLGALALIVLLVLCVSALISPDWRQAVSKHDFAAVMLVPYFTVGLFVVFHVYILAFVLAYLAAHGFVGGFAAIPLGAVTAASLTTSYTLNAVFGPRVPLWPTLFFVAVFCAAGALMVMRWAAPWRERRERRGWRLGLKVAGVLTAGAVISLMSAGNFEQWMARSPQFVSGDLEDWNRRYGFQSDQTERLAASGVLLQSLDGALLWMTPEGQTRTLIPGGRVTAHEMLDEAFANNIRTAGLGKSGTLWVNRVDRYGNTSEIWAGPLSGPLMRESNAKLADKAIENRLPEERAMARAYDGRVLKELDGRRVWRLPGRTARDWDFFSQLVGGRLVFLVPVRLSAGRMALAVCGDKGKVELKWDGKEVLPPMRWDTSPDGALWSWSGDKLFIATTEGVFLPPIKVEKRVVDSFWPPLVHQDGQSAWLLSRDRVLIKVNMVSGQIEHQWFLPDPIVMTDHFLTPVKPLARGLFVRTPRDLFFYDWDGNRRRIAI